METPTRQEFAAAFVLHWHHNALEQVAIRAQATLYDDQSNADTTRWFSGSLVHEELSQWQSLADEFHRKLEHALVFIREHPWIQSHPVRTRCIQDVQKAYQIEAFTLLEEPRYPCCFTGRKDQCVVLHCTLYDQPSIMRQSQTHTKRFVVHSELTLSFLYAVQWIGVVTQWMKQQATHHNENTHLSQQHESALQMHEYDLLFRCFTVVRLFLKCHDTLLSD